MKVLVLLVSVAFASAGRLDTAYLPPSGDHSVGVVQARSQSQAHILRLDNEVDDQGFHYAYETSDGTQAEQQGRVLPGATEDSGSLQVSGSYSYVGPDGHTYSVRYTADENGFRAEGDHLPTPPPVPEEIARSLALIAQQPQNPNDDGQYHAGVETYSAKSGYHY